VVANLVLSVLWLQSWCCYYCGYNTGVTMVMVTKLVLLLVSLLLWIQYECCYYSGYNADVVRIVVTVLVSLKPIRLDLFPLSWI